LLWLHYGDILRLPLLTPAEVLTFVSKLTLWMGLAGSGALMLLAGLDYLYQRFDYEKNIRMSKQGLVMMTSAFGTSCIIRLIAISRCFCLILDLIIGSPAIALKYDEKKMDAPYIVAKGVDHLALKIRQIAKEHDVMTIENRPLARALYDQVCCFSLLLNLKFTILFVSFYIHKPKFPQRL
jgi:flagellar biosynthetic protein FlhB